MSSVRRISATLLSASAVVLAICAAIGTAPAFCAEKTLYKFQNGSDGAQPYAGLIADRAGNLYGTTAFGGGHQSCQGLDCGTVFKLAPDGSETMLYAFTGGNDGGWPVGGLIADGNGNLYGTAEIGGAFQNGTVFRIAPDGSETTLYAFQGGSDGSHPESTLLVNGNGDLFGTTVSGGSFNGSDCSTAGCGTVFGLRQDGVKATLYAFQGGSDGWAPTGELIVDESGNLYGTTTNGGSACDCGTAFEISPVGTETQLHVFQGGSQDGAMPYAGLVADAAGNLYGTTAAGGSCKQNRSGCGTVFKLSPRGKETVLITFQGGNYGSEPLSGLIMDKTGNLYGTTSWGGNDRCNHKGCGSVFELTTQGVEKILYGFQSSHGHLPRAGLLLGSHGELYGTATEGGTNNNGVVFELKK